jgi:hypothetical protein
MIRLCNGTLLLNTKESGEIKHQPLIILYLLWASNLLFVMCNMRNYASVKQTIAILYLVYCYKKYQRHI